MPEDRAQELPQSAGNPYWVLNEMIHSAVLAAPYELPALIDTCARDLGARMATCYLVDLEQRTLVPFLDPNGRTAALREGSPELTALEVDSTLAGRCFQTSETSLQELEGGGALLWMPLLNATERLGVISVVVESSDALVEGSASLREILHRLATHAATLIISKSPHGDTLTRLRRPTPLGLPAEMQSSVLPPLTFQSDRVTVAAALEPVYLAAGDIIDYAVDEGTAHVAVFDGMGHGLQAAQCAVLTVAAYRNARRSGRTLSETVAGIDEALLLSYGGEVFTTGVIATLETTTGLLQWVNAGHPNPLLLRAGRLIKSLDIAPRPPLGLGHLQDPIVSTVGSENLQPGDRILLFTDGVIEARSPDGEFFGTDRLAELVIRHLAGGLSAPETMRRVVRELVSHQDGQLTDDASLLLLEWTGPGSTLT